MLLREPTGCINIPNRVPEAWNKLKPLGHNHRRPRIIVLRETGKEGRDR